MSTSAIPHLKVYKRPKTDLAISIILIEGPFSTALTDQTRTEKLKVFAALSDSSVEVDFDGAVR
jgi:hypothetical protein